MLSHEFMRLAFGAGAVVGVLAPAVGFFLVQRRMSLIGDGIGHVAFAGVALGYLLGIAPVATALVALLSRKDGGSSAHSNGGKIPGHKHWYEVDPMMGMEELLQAQRIQAQKSAEGEGLH